MKWKAVRTAEHRLDRQDGEKEEKKINVDIRSYELTQLAEFVEQLGEKPYRAKQIYQWLHEKQVSSFDEMTNISLQLREQLKQSCALTVLQPIDVRISALDGTRKYLFALPDAM